MAKGIVSMKTIGVLGGMSTAATQEYYRLINLLVNLERGEHNVAEIIISSVNFQNIERFVRSNQWEEAGCYLAEKALGLERAGVDFLLLATNTMHRVRDAIKGAVSIPFVDIIETAAEVIGCSGIARVAMLGTYPVMTDSFYQKAYQEFGISLISPAESEKREIDRIIFEELCHHKYPPTSREFFLRVIEDLVRKGAQGVVLGCTEIKLLINQSDMPDLPFFDTTELHCRRAVELCLA